MTTPKEAPELKCCPFCGGEAESDSQRGYRNMTTGKPEAEAAIYCTSCNADMTWCYCDTPEIERDQVMTLLIEQWNARATPSFEGDAVERVARIVNPQAFDETHWMHGRMREQQYAKERARAILATGLVPDEAVKDTYLVGGADLKAMSGDIDSDRVIKLHFRRRVTDKDRERLLDAINLKIKADQDAVAIRSNRREA